ncbi:Protein of unknown function DUF639 [Cynara cardunculus var. scolymus]|uniref:Uncharacterized protein n=1 Tax=Cynara cardunculus var. scolymus TaxID=59895 RepID=A0A103XGW3_CYNCS|nr:Protein of unknown function DUF639 [Cynara cardunculus var. scolymus]
METTRNLSSIADDVLQRCALRLETPVNELIKEFEGGWKGEKAEYPRKLVEHVSSKALYEICKDVEQAIREGTFSKLTFDMMLAWETPTTADEESRTIKILLMRLWIKGMWRGSHTEEDAGINEGRVEECVAKEKEERKKPANEKPPNKHDEVPLFYSDIMPLLVNDKPSVGERAFVWLGLLVPLVADYINGRFTFETLTASTDNRLHFPAYNKFLQEIDKCVKHLQKQATPRNVEMADDEFILHVEGTASSQRVIRHIGKQSWPGRLTLTNYALYFEASGSMSYENAFKLDLSKDIDQSIKPAATGPFGAPLFDKAIIYESAELEEGFHIEFPELTSSTRRDHWLALVKEIMLLHKFLAKFKVESPLQAWEIHARTILGIIRLHAAREMLRISPPHPKSFLIFALFDELPTGNNVLDELAESLKSVKSGHPCSGSSILRNLNVSQGCIPCAESEVGTEQSENASNQPANLSSLETAVEQVREEAKEINTAKATADELKEDGIGDSALVLMELVEPLKSALPWFQERVGWPGHSSILNVYGFKTDLGKTKESRQANQHTDAVITAMILSAVVLAVIPLKYMIMGVVLSTFAMTLISGDSKDKKNKMGNRRLEGWWDSIPVIPVEVVQMPKDDSGQKNE